MFRVSVAVSLLMTGDLGGRFSGESRTIESLVLLRRGVPNVLYFPSILEKELMFNKWKKKNLIFTYFRAIEAYSV